jgi:Family of unknown function (DUF5330)
VRHLPGRAGWACRGRERHGFPDHGERPVARTADALGARREENIAACARADSDAIGNGADSHKFYGKFYFVELREICGVFYSIMGKNVRTSRTPLSAIRAKLRAGAATQTAGDVSIMFFLLRMAFWLGLVLLLLPTGTASRGPAVSDVGAGNAISAASATVSDLRGFCSRQPDACTVGSQVATALGHRAQAGAKMLYDTLTEALGGQTGSVGSGTSRRGAAKTASENSPSERASQDTLTATDLIPAWRGPLPRKDARHSI